MKFVLFKKSLEEGAAPIYLFDGEEEYFKERGEDNWVRYREWRDKFPSGS